MLPDLAADNTVVVDADLLYTNTGEGLHRFVDPLDGEVYLYSQFETADAKRVYACFDQPDLKADVHLPRHRARPLAGRLERREISPSTEPPAGKTVHFATTARISPYITAVVAGPYHVVRDHHDGIDLGLVVPQDARRAPRRRRAVRDHQAGLRLVPRQLRRALRVRQVRPAVRARVQRRRDGERRLRDVPRGLRLPQQGHRCALRAARRDDPARDGAHVVRRPRHHALVGRPVAQRVLRDLTPRPCARPRPPAGRTRGRRSPTSRRRGPTGRTSCRRRTRSRPTRPTCRPPRSTSTASPTPRARACSSSSAPTSASRSSWPGCAQYFVDHAYGNTTLADLLARAREVLRPRPAALVEGLARDGRHQHDPAGVHPRRGRAITPRSSSCRPPRPRWPPRTSCVRTGSRSACTTTMPTPDSWSGPAGSSSTSAGERTRSRISSAWPNRTCCWSTTTTSPTASCAWTSAACAPCAPAASRGWPSRCRARCAGRPPGT